MDRFARIALTGVCAVFSSAPLGAQQGQGQKPLPQVGQKAPSTPGSIGQQGVYHGGLGQTPWFNNSDIRQQFKLSDTQYNQLNKGYGEAYGRYQQDMTGFGTGLSDQQRTQKIGELQQRFHKNFATTTNEVFTDPQQRQRYNQLYLQYQGYNAFSDPIVQERLNLTSDQRQQLGRRGQEWHQRMNDLGRTYQTDREGTTRKFNEMRKQSGEWINGLLNPEQRNSWHQLTGDSYSFQPSSYFQTSAGVGQGTTIRQQESPPPQ